MAYKRSYKSAFGKTRRPLKRRRFKPRRRLIAKRRRVKSRRFSTISGLRFTTRWVKSKYVDHQSNQQFVTGAFSNATTISGWIYRANSVFDPKYAATGTYNVRSTAHAFLATMYNKYCVVRATCVVEVSQGLMLEDDGREMVFILKVDADASLPAQKFSAFIQDEDTCLRKFKANADGTARVTLKITYDAKRWNKNPKPWTDPTLNTAVAANPSDEVYFIFGGVMADGAVATPSCEFNITTRIYYTVVYNDIRDIAETTGMIMQ